MPEQTVQAQIKLLWKEKFDLGLHYFPFRHIILDTSTDNQIQWTLVTTTAFVPKDVAIKMNVLLYRTLNEQTDM